MAHCDQFPIPLPEGHRFPISKYARIRCELVDRGVLAPGDLHPSQPASVAALLRAHSSGYVRSILEGTAGSTAMRRIGLPWSPALVARSRASVGGTLEAARVALRTGFAGNLAGGTHHAFADSGSGFCVFNDLAVAALTLLDEAAVERILIVDLDVHQGDGTAAIFADDPRVFTLSVHGAKNFPFTKQRSDLDVELPDGTDDDGYLDALVPAMESGLAQAQPDLVLIQGGVDPLASDALGRLALSAEGLRRRDRHVLGTLARLEIPAVMTLGGGYAVPLQETVDAHVATYQVAREFHG